MTNHANLLQLALAGDATATAELWRAIDQGNVDDATTASWARSVAAQVVSKVINPEIQANRARENARAALGLEGRLSRDRELEDLVMMLPDATPSSIANAADLLIDVGGADRYQVKRKVEYIKSKLKKGKIKKLK